MIKKILLSALTIISISCASKKEIVNSASYSDQIVQHQAEYMQDFIADPRAPLDEEDLKYVQFFAPDAAYRCDCTVRVTPDAPPFDMSTYSGQTQPYRQYGIATCSLNGNTIDVHLYSNIRAMSIPGYKDHLFLPFKDHTNGEATYGGGRYIDLKTGDIQDGKVTIDFNKCYNPWCAYSDGYNCPIPPVENHFDMEIKAGEKMWLGKKKK